jgi:ADP-heptose:LPS heptosyltransferase
MSQVQEITGEPVPFWIIVAGGKTDYTIKWWDSTRWQEVVDHFRGRILFVQVGEARHIHPRLDGVLDFRGLTDLRQLVRLVYHAQGVVCPVTSLMHLAAAWKSRVVSPRTGHVSSLPAVGSRRSGRHIHIINSFTPTGAALL